MLGIGISLIRTDTEDPEMSDLPVQKNHFKVDTSRPHSRIKFRSKVRHVMAVASGMFPLMALFVYGVSFLRLPIERKPYNLLTVIFLACGMVALMFYAWARSEKQRRHEVSKRNKELRYQRRAEAARREDAQRQAQKAGTIEKEG